MGDEPLTGKTSRAECAGLGIALGAGIGTALVATAGHLAVWLPIGIAGVLLLGSSSREEGKVRAVSLLMPLPCTALSGDGRIPNYARGLGSELEELCEGIFN